MALSQNEELRELLVQKNSQSVEAARTRAQLETAELQLKIAQNESKR